MVTMEFFSHITGYYAILCLETTTPSMPSCLPLRQEAKGGPTFPELHFQRHSHISSRAPGGNKLQLCEHLFTEHEHAQVIIPTTPGLWPGTRVVLGYACHRLNQTVRSSIWTPSQTPVLLVALPPSPSSESLDRGSRQETGQSYRGIGG